MISLLFCYREKMAIPQKRFNDLTDTALAVLLRSDLLQLDEIEILEKVKKWAKTNAISSGQSARKVSCQLLKVNLL